MRERRLASEHARGRGRNRPSHEPVASAPARSQAGATVYNEHVRRALDSGALAVAALIPPIVWLLPALGSGRAPTFRDQTDFFFPLKLYTVDRLRAGHLPLWNPLSGAGEPWLANGQSGVFYLPTLFFLLPSPALGAGCFLLLHFALAAWGMWRFCKEEGVTDAGALAAAAIFAASGLSASLSAYWNHFGAFAYLPLILALARSGPRLAPPLRASACCSACRPWPEARSFRSRRSRSPSSSSSSDAPSPRAAGGKRRRARACAGEPRPRRSGWRWRHGCSCRWPSSPCTRVVARPFPRPSATSARCASGRSSRRSGGGGRARQEFLLRLRVSDPSPWSLLPPPSRNVTVVPRCGLAVGAAARARVVRGSPAGDLAAGAARLEPHPIPRQGARRDALRGCRHGRSGLGHAAVPAGPPQEAVFRPAGGGRGCRRRGAGGRRRGCAVTAAGAARCRCWRSFARGPRSSARRFRGSRRSLIASLTLSSGGLFRFAPGDQIARRPESSAFLAGVPGRILTPPMGHWRPGCRAIGVSTPPWSGGSGSP